MSFTVIYKLQRLWLNSKKSNTKELRDTASAMCRFSHIQAAANTSQIKKNNPEWWSITSANLSRAGSGPLRKTTTGVCKVTQLRTQPSWWKTHNRSPREPAFCKQSARTRSARLWPKAEKGKHQGRSQTRSSFSQNGNRAGEPKEAPLQRPSAEEVDCINPLASPRPSLSKPVLLDPTLVLTTLSLCTSTTAWNNPLSIC